MDRQVGRYLVAGQGGRRMDVQIGGYMQLVDGWRVNGRWMDDGGGGYNW